ncbi:TKL/LISK/LISK-DD1 protein kinase [Flagelloscypha sp. PMI_526]|nr:TKL/LISK/LISK-DD1 protein kinase [Flagelloscypha sp. PMI_526]
MTRGVTRTGSGPFFCLSHHHLSRRAPEGFRFPCTLAFLFYHSFILMSKHSDAFDVIPYDDIKGDWKKLGSGSFGNVYKGTYLGIDVAIKEVLPSSEYDVAKYFEREWRLMKETRHPNAVLFIGLSRAPAPDNRIFIISEFIDNGNLRIFIHDKTKPFPWRLRMSFATDIARALAYLHARKCIHRDLKGENLLVTSNGRIKITDFGFARIAARNEEESKRLTFCGTDSYMSPEIMQGEEFDLPTDIFSLGIVFCEILARKLADDHHFKRMAPHFDIDEEEVRMRASPGCPEDFIKLTLECLSTDPASRPTTREILDRLRPIEAEVLSRKDESEEDAHIGSIKLMGTGSKRPTVGPRIPSFGVGVGKDIRSSHSSDDSDDELMEAISTLNSVNLGSKFTDRSSGTISNEPLLQRNGSGESEYSTTVIRPQKKDASPPPALSSILTIRPDHQVQNSPSQPILSGPAASTFSMNDPLNSSSIMSIATLDSYHTAAAPSIMTTSTANATEGGSTIRSLHGNYAAPLVHRFSLIKPGAKPKIKSIGSSKDLVFPGKDNEKAGGSTTPGSSSWNPLDLFFPSGLLVSKCDVCSKRLGWKPVLECDDCGMRAHLKCGDLAPHDCGVRPSRPGVHHSFQTEPAPAPSANPAKATKSSKKA